MPKSPIVLKTEVTSRQVTRIARHFKAQIVESLLVGFKYIADVLWHLEQNGAYRLPTVSAPITIGKLASLTSRRPMTEVTRILSAIEQGEPHAAQQLLPLVYDELRKLAEAKLAHEKPGQTLDATALVHEAYVRLVTSSESASPGRESGGSEPKWNSRGHFFGAAAEAMRRILVEKARRRGRLKHGRKHQRVELDSSCLVSEAPSYDLLALDEALTRLAEADPAKADLVKLRFFAGLTMPEAAAALDISLATAERYWTFAKSWLYAELADDDG
jgi:RNA polymerase sigma factor (TIGR02999 family)